jgi:hypothetical protein
MAKKIYTFFKLHQNVGVVEPGDASMETATVIADNKDEAEKECRKQFEPEAYHEIDMDLLCKLRDMKDSPATIVANIDDIKEI